MLEHDNLESYRDGERYDIEDPSDVGVEFYSALAREVGSPVLEIACGTGRVAIPVARAGFRVTGVDIAPSMLAQARRKSGDLPVRWVRADAREFDLGERYRLIYITGNSFQAFLTRADQEALLDRVRAHLHPEGLFAFETRNPRWTHADPGVDPRGLFVRLESREEERLWREYTDPDGQLVRIYKAQRYDPIAQLLHMRSTRRRGEGDRAKVAVTRIALRFTFPQELEALLDYNGFTVLRRFGDWDHSALSADSPSIISVCGLRQGH